MRGTFPFCLPFFAKRCSSRPICALRGSTACVNFSQRVRSGPSRLSSQGGGKKTGMRVSDAFSQVLACLAPRGPKGRRNRAWGFNPRSAGDPGSIRSPEAPLLGLKPQALFLRPFGPETVDLPEPTEPWRGGTSPVLTKKRLKTTSLSFSPLPVREGREGKGEGPGVRVRLSLRRRERQSAWLRENS